MPDLTYRSIQPGDHDALAALATDWSVVRQLGGWNWPPDPQQIRDRATPYTGDGFVWAICVADRMIGTLGVTNGDLGYMLHPDWHGRGVMTIAATRAIEHAFATTARDHLTGSTWYDNVGSARILTKLGFVFWQTRYLRSRARRRPTLCYHARLTRSDWDRLRNSAH